VRKKVGVIVGLLFILVLGGLVIPLHFFHSAHAEAQDQPMDIGSLPPLVSLSQLLGSDTSDRTLQMSVGLALRNQEQLSALLQSLYDPSSSNYHQYLTPDQFAQQFGPTAGQRQQVIDYVTGQGFSVTQTYPTLIDFSGPQSLAERVFGVTINDYTAPDGRSFFSNATAPTLPAYIAQSIVSISGLDNANQFSHPPVPARGAPSLSSNAAANCPAPGTSGGGGGGIFGGSSTAYIPSQFSKAYNYDGLHNAGLHGEGQTVGVLCAGVVARGSRAAGEARYAHDAAVLAEDVGHEQVAAERVTSQVGGYVEISINVVCPLVSCHAGYTGTAQRSPS